MMNLSRVLFLVLVGVVLGKEAVRECNPIDELQCDNGYCITKLQWCDASLDCLDGSDEMYCNGVTPCKSNHFRCRNGKCIPSSAVCDSYDDCHDHSDEDECDGNKWLDDSPIEHSDLQFPNFVKRDIPSQLGNVTKDALAKAVQYLMNMREADYSWGVFTPRAIVALTLAGKVSPLADTEIQLMQKQLNIQLLVDLIKNPNLSLSSLALYINALYATCQDPRYFQGEDLVARLRSETDVAMKSNFSTPLAFLTLCISDKTNLYDGMKLAEMYNSKEFSRTGSRALIVMAMVCMMRRQNSNMFESYVFDFLTNEDAKVATTDIYSWALFMQASNAMGQQTPVADLLNEQLLDGSFGDALATYYAIPVLMNSSLLELLHITCDNRNNGMFLDSQIAGINGENEIAISLWITSGKDVNAHSMTMKFDGKKSLFDIMMMAAARDHTYKFLYDESSNGKMVYSLAGIPSDIESGKSWILYSGDIDSVRVNSVESLRTEFVGIDRIFPDDKDHFVFWLKRSLSDY